MVMARLLVGVAAVASGLQLPGQEGKSLRPQCDPCTICECKKDVNASEVYGENFGKATGKLKPEFDTKWKGCKTPLECDTWAICSKYEKTADDVLIPDCRMQPSICHVGGRTVIPMTFDDGSIVGSNVPMGVASFCRTEFCNLKCAVGPEEPHVPFTHFGKVKNQSALAQEGGQMKAMKKSVDDENARREDLWKKASAEDQKQMFPKDPIIYTNPKPLVQKTPYEKPPPHPDNVPQSSAVIGNGWSKVNKTEEAKKKDEEEEAGQQEGPKAKLAKASAVALPSMKTDKPYFAATGHQHFVQANTPPPAQGSKMDAIFDKLDQQLKEQKENFAKQQKEMQATAAAQEDRDKKVSEMVGQIVAAAEQRQKEAAANYAAAHAASVAAEQRRAANRKK